MKMPPNSPDMTAAVDNLHRDIDEVEQLTLGTIDTLAKSGIADKRWCAIARTNVEQGIMALHRALRDYPGDDPNQYGKVPLDGQLPSQFTPPPAGDFQQQAAKRIAVITNKIDWKDYGADAGMDKPQPPFE